MAYRVYLFSMSDRGKQAKAVALTMAGQWHGLVKWANSCILIQIILRPTQNIKFFQAMLMLPVTSLTNTYWPNH